ncbi:diacylglycerol/lipid kinase family protein [Sphaerotilus mobilis]|uniref:Diacylglycerol kinase family enzyme n=1 Tax=Sphaerotilus mobilis TaxID=47994 RepID=A0A4Q7LID9_9BURK|nr:diacylglycerol kinase family protein [Sphaerotilus mobilis]RZS53248.1 diacylglycerol kinase family enzyme [Sphaerotilus mobilis]
MSLPPSSQPAGVVMLNRHADGGRALALRRPIESWLARHAPGVALLVPDSPDAALATLAILAVRTRVVLVGGDGTLQRMLPALMRCGHRVGLVAAGRHNDVARALGIAGLLWREALPYALYAPTAAVDLGQYETEADTRHFVGRLSVGLAARQDLLAAGLPRWWPLPARQIASGLAARATGASQALKIWVNGQLEHDGPAWSVSVCNASGALGGLQQAPHARLDDHRLDTLVLGEAGPAVFWRMRRGRHIHPPQISLHNTRKLLVDAAEPMAITIDGEPQTATTRFSARVLPRALHVVGAHMLGVPVTERQADAVRSRALGHGLPLEPLSAPTQPAALPVAVAAAVSAAVPAELAAHEPDAPPSTFPMPLAD